MNKSELIAAMAEECAMTKSDTEKVLDSFMRQVEQALNRGDKVQLVGFGSFEVKARGERMGRNPKTKEEIRIPASRTPCFKAGKKLKDAIG